MTEPTAEGLLRYRETHGFHSDLSKNSEEPDHQYPCTCLPTCKPRCDGICLCPACSLSFTIFCDESGFPGPEGLTISTDDAVAAYRSF